MNGRDTGSPDVVLFSPAPRSGWQAQRRVEMPLSLLCPATPLVQRGYRVRIVEQYDNPLWKRELIRADVGLSISRLQIRADTLLRMDDALLGLLVRARVRRHSIGVESGDQKMLDLIRKDMPAGRVVEANRRLAGYPIVPVVLFMMGLPTGTPEQSARSVRLAIRLTDGNPRAVRRFSIDTPDPGAPPCDTAAGLGLKPPERLRDGATFNSRNLPGRTPWVVPETRRLIEGLDFPLRFPGKGRFVTPYTATNPLVASPARVCQPLARYRVRHLDTRFPIETRLVKSLGLSGRQD